MAAEGARMMYGIQRYYTEQDIPPIDSGFRGILQLNHFDTAHDLRFAMKVSSIVTQKTLRALHDEILSATKFSNFLS
jgi:hypothetical protein